MEQESASLPEGLQVLVASAKELADGASLFEGFVVAAANFELAQASHWFVTSPGGRSQIEGISFCFPRSSTGRVSDSAS
jgi:hypothetical protein